jgi:hypothetical protein
MMRLTPLLCSIACSALLLGCGGGASDDNKVPVFPVTGTVTMNGSGLAGATVAFAPQGDQPTAIATTDDNGNFTLRTYDADDGAAEGKYKVVVTKSEVTGEISDADAEHEAVTKGEPVASEHAAAGAGGTKQLVPAAYTSSDTTPLEADVKSSGDNTFDFKIE